MATMKKIEPWLYQLDHTTKTGEVSTRYYALFTTWNRQKLCKALGTDLKEARQKLKWLRSQNENEEPVIELTEERQLRKELKRQEEEQEKIRRGITFAEFGQQYFDDVIYPDDESSPDCRTWDGIKRKSTVHGQELRFKSLKSFFADRSLVDIESNDAEEHRRMRLRDGPHSQPTLVI